MGTAYNFLTDPYLIDNEIVAKRHYGRFKIRDDRHWKIQVNGKDLPMKWFKDMSPKGMHIQMGIREDVEVGAKIPIVIRLNGQDFFKCMAVVRWKAMSREGINLSDVGLEFVDNFDQPQYAWQPSEDLRDYLESVKTRSGRAKEIPFFGRTLFITGTEVFLAVFLPLVLGFISTL